MRHKENVEFASVRKGHCLGGASIQSPVMVPVRVCWVGTRHLSAAREKLLQEVLLVSTHSTGTFSRVSREVIRVHA